MLKHQKIGTFFQKENIFLGILWIYPMGKDYFENNNSGFKIMDMYERMCEVNEQFANRPQYKIVIAYKCGDDYMVFRGKKLKKIKGDNSNKKEELDGLVSIWKYYTEEQLSEITLESGDHIIIDLTKGLKTPKQKYKKDYFSKSHN